MADSRAVLPVNKKAFRPFRQLNEENQLTIFNCCYLPLDCRYRTPCGITYIFKKQIQKKYLAGFGIVSCVRMINTFQEQLFQRMPPVRIRKLATRKSFSRSSRFKNKENESPVSTSMALQYNLVHSTPVKNEQVTDLDEVESETELTEADLFGIEEVTEAKQEFTDETEPKLVISKIYDLTNNCVCGSAENFTEFRKDYTGDAGVNVFHIEKFDDTNDGHWRSLENLHETAEYEFCRSLEESKLFVSTASLLEEIEADLPSLYSLAKPLNHTFHTLTSYRTQTRLARMDGNLTCPEILNQQETLKRITTPKKIDQLEMEAVVQKALVKQAEKALVISKTNKMFGLQNVECEKALLLANLRHNAVMQEVKKLRMLEVPEKENYGQITISDICFEVNEPSNITTGTYICTATERETVQNTSVVNEVTNGILRFDNELKFSNLGKDFIIYIDLFKLPDKEPKKMLLTSALKKKFKKMTAVNLSRSLTTSNYSLSGFFCVAQCELRLDNVERKGEKCVLQNYLTVNLHHPVAGSSVNVVVKTDIHLRTKQSGFLNVFKKTWHRRWFSQSGFFLESWHYPEDEESNKASLDSVYLPNCGSIEAVGLEVCIRPHSFVIRLKKTNEEILFSANSHKDMLTWINHLNLMFELIHIWKPNL